MIDPLLVETLVSRASGSAGTLTFGYNQHGPWVRDRIAPTDPATERQLPIRTRMRTFTDRWANVLTDAQRQSWAMYASSVYIPGRLGRSNQIGALPHYLRSAFPRLQVTAPPLPVIDTAPQHFDLGPFTPLSRVVLNIVDDTVHPFFAPTDTWATEPGAAMLFWASAPRPLSVNFHKGPYRFAGQIRGRVFPPHRPPATVPLPFPAGTDQRVFIRGRVTRADGRLSPSFRLPADIVPQVAPLPINATFLFGPPNAVQVTFDSLIRDQPHDVANWFVRFDAVLYRIVVIVTRDDFLRLTLTFDRFLAGPDIVSYDPPPFDVNGLLTGLPVQPFFAFPIT